MSDTPETIYLIPGEDIDGRMGWLWCDDPAPHHDHDPAEAVKYVRADVHQAIIDRQAKSALMGMDAAKHHALSAEQNARRLLAESNPEAIESERAANAQLTQELERAQARVAELEAEEEGAEEALAAVVEKRQILEAKVSKMERSLEVMRSELAKRPTTGGAW